MGITWGAAWLGAGLALLLVVGPDAADVPFPLFFGLLGFLAGVTFSGILAVVEGRRSLEQMSLPRIAAWGGVGGFLLSAAMATGLGAESLPVLGPIFALSGATCAAGSLALARRAQQRDSLHPAAEMDEVGLTEREVRELLGSKGGPSEPPDSRR